MGLRLITAPVVEPVTLAEAKKQVEIPAASSAHEALLESLIVAGRETVERLTRRALIDQTWELTLSEFPCEIQLPRPPLIEVTDVTYMADYQVWESLDAVTYQVTTGSNPGCVAPAVGQTWPATQAGAVEAVRIRYRAGYGVDADSIPAALKNAVLMLVDYWFERRDGLHSELLNLEAPQHVVWTLKGHHCGMVSGAYGVTL